MPSVLPRLRPRQGAPRSHASKSEQLLRPAASFSSLFQLSPAQPTARVPCCCVSAEAITAVARALAEAAHEGAGSIEHVHELAEPSFCSGMPLIVFPHRRQSHPPVLLIQAELTAMLLVLASKLCLNNETIKAIYVIVERMLANNFILTPRNVRRVLLAATSLAEKQHKGKTAPESDIGVRIRSALDSIKGLELLDEMETAVARTFKGNDALFEDVKYREAAFAYVLGRLRNDVAAMRMFRFVFGCLLSIVADLHSVSLEEPGDFFADEEFYGFG